MLRKYAFLFPLLVAAIASGQDVQVNRQNKTIAVTADESTTADAEVAVLAIGYHNYASTQEAAFRENVKVAEQVVNALIKAGASPNIETDKLRLGLTEIGEKWSEEMKKDRRFEAQQSWHVTVPAGQAQAVVDLAVKAGANEVDDVEWDVADPVALQAKASGAALAKARSIAEQMAKGLGTKLGELVYASNHAPVAKMWRGASFSAETVTVAATAENPPQPKLKLFPQKVKSNATVYAVFAIE
jgi:uncharacterized protein YggE